MAIFHPIFIFAFVLIIIASYLEQSQPIKNKKGLIAFIALILIIAAGGRTDVGADFPIYRQLYQTAFPLYTNYGDVWDKMTFQPNSMEIEWLFVLVNKILFDMGMPFYYVTFFVAIVSISLQFDTFYKYSALPMFSILFYFMPSFFFSESGQMRQGLGIAVCIFSLRYINKRDLWKFLFCMFIALGFHKSAIVFIPAYWLVLLPFNASRWTTLLVISVLLSPFEVYTLFGNLFSSLTPQDVSNAYTGYLNDRYYGQDIETGKNDVIKLIIVIIVLLYDKEAEKKIPYYEYFRNLAFFGYCLFYILRGNAIFATRLPGVYVVIMGYFVLPGIIASVKVETRRLLQVGFTVYFILLSMVFMNVNGRKGRFTSDTYDNVLW